MCSPSWNPLPPPSPSSLRVIPAHQPWAPCLMHRTRTGDLFHISYTCFNATLSNHPTLAFSHRVQKTVLCICVSFAVSHKWYFFHTLFVCEIEEKLYGEKQNKSSVCCKGRKERTWSARGRTAALEGGRGGGREVSWWQKGGEQTAWKPTGAQVSPKWRESPPKGVSQQNNMMSSITLAVCWWWIQARQEWRRGQG